MREPEQAELFDDDYVHDVYLVETDEEALSSAGFGMNEDYSNCEQTWDCLLYTSPSPRDLSTSRMPSSA